MLSSVSTKSYCFPEGMLVCGIYSSDSVVVWCAMKTEADSSHCVCVNDMMVVRGVCCSGCSLLLAAINLFRANTKHTVSLSVYITADWFK
jgi:hypothetical protein